MRVAIVTVGVVSHLNQCFRIAERLVTRGHEVTFVSSNASVSRRVEAQGLPFVLLERKREARQRWASSPARQTAGWRRVLHWRGIVRAEAELSRATLDDDEIERLMEELRPDVVLLDYELHDTIVRVAATGRPLMLLDYHCSPLRRRGLPILSSHQLPGRGPMNGVAIALRWQATLLKRRLKFASQRLLFAGDDWWSTLHSLGRQVGFDLRGETSRAHWHFLTYRNLPTLYLSPREFDFPHEAPNDAFHVGPMIAVDRREPTVDEESRVLLAELEARDRTRPLVFCAMGSILSNVPYYRRVIQAFADRPEWDLVLATGRDVNKDRFGPLPPNVRVLGYVPQLEVLRQADLMLHHAGLATIFECIYFGVPMLAYSGGHLEENGNAARVEFHGLGLRGDIAREQPDQIAEKVQRVLSEPAFRDAVREMQRVFRACHASDLWVDLVERRASASAQELGWQRL